MYGLPQAALKQMGSCERCVAKAVNTTPQLIFRSVRDWFFFDQLEFKIPRSETPFHKEVQLFQPVVQWVPCILNVFMLTMMPGVAQTLEEQKVTTNMTLKITLQNKNLQNCTPKKRNSRIILGKKGLLPKNLFPWKNYKSTEQRLVAEIPKFESCAGKNLPGSVSLGFFQSYKLTWLAIENHPFF